jgi:hypothetical protein
MEQKPSMKRLFANSKFSQPFILHEVVREESAGYEFLDWLAVGRFSNP